MRPCADVVPLLGPYLDGELEADDREFVDDHLCGCSSCRARRDFLRAQGDALRDQFARRADAADFGGFADGVLARVREERRPRPLERARVWTSEMLFVHRRAVAATAGFAVAACAALVVLFAPPRHPPIMLADAHPQIDELDFDTHDGAVLQLPRDTTVIWLSDDAPALTPAGVHR